MVAKSMAAKRMQQELMKVYKANMFKNSGSIGMTKGQLAIALSSLCDQKMKDMVKILKALQEIAAEDVKTKGHFTIPGIAMIGAKPKFYTWRKSALHGVKAFPLWSLEQVPQQQF